jgi:hypothetical protein
MRDHAPQPGKKEAELQIGVFFNLLNFREEMGKRKILSRMLEDIP